MASQEKQVLTQAQILEYTHEMLVSLEKLTKPFCTGELSRLIAVAAFRAAKDRAGATDYPKQSQSPPLLSQQG